MQMPTWLKSGGNVLLSKTKVKVNARAWHEVFAARMCLHLASSSGCSCRDWIGSLLTLS